MPEVDPAARPQRRRFSAEYKATILAEYEAAPDGEKGSVLRREGLYSSQITEWRQARDAGALGGLEPGTRQPTRSAAEVELAKLKARHRHRSRAGPDPNGARHHGKSFRALGVVGRERGHRQEVSEVTLAACDELVPVVGTTRACRLTGRSKATHYRAMTGPVHGPPAPRPTPPNALSPEERAEVLAVLGSPAYADLAVAQVWAMLLDDGTYLASQSTMHRVLRACGENRDRRRQRTHPAKKKPHLVAHQPLDVWSWDIERHEALSNRAVVKGHRRPAVAAAG